jgi:hypothetical protein
MVDKNNLASRELQHIVTIYQKFLERVTKGKVKCTLAQALRLCTGCMARRGSRGIALFFLDHSTRRGQCHAPAALYPGERPSTHCTGGWVCPRPSLDRCGKSCTPPGFDPRTIQPITSRYTNYTTQPTLKGYFNLNVDILSYIF